MNAYSKSEKKIKWWEKITAYEKITICSLQNSKNDSQ